MNEADLINQINREVFRILLLKQEEKNNIVNQVTSEDLLSLLVLHAKASIDELYKRYPDILQKYDTAHIIELEGTFMQAAGLGTYIYYVDECLIKKEKIVLPVGKGLKKFLAKNIDE